MENRKVGPHFPTLSIIPPAGSPVGGFFSPILATDNRSEIFPINRLL